MPLGTLEGYNCGAVPTSSTYTGATGGSVTIGRAPVLAVADEAVPGSCGK